MNSKLVCRIAGIVTLSLLISSTTHAQDRNAVIQAFNEGAKLTQTDIPGAIKAFENAIMLADKVGETATDMRQKAVGVLPGLYNRVASTAMSEKKPATEIMTAVRAAIAVAGKYGTPAQKETTSKLLIQAYNIQASEYFSKKDFASALATFDSLLTISPDNMNAIYNKAFIYYTQGNSDLFEQTIDKYISAAKAVGDQTSAGKGATLALGYFRSAGSKANQASKLDDALSLLDKAAKYGDDKDLFYYYADVYNKKKNFDKGADYAKRGLDLETGAQEYKAKFYFQLGTAQAGKGQTAEACASYKNAVYGVFAEASKAQLQNLKCK
jgi:tetratricopeptide (TPR) repeat protein